MSSVQTQRRVRGIGKAAAIALSQAGMDVAKVKSLNICERSKSSAHKC